MIGGLDYLGFTDVGEEAAFGTLTIPHYTFAIFQCAFAAITVAIISGGHRRTYFLCGMDDFFQLYG
ncbi:hypothetical protein GCM10020331_087530 [Ectobacillus funiculus]